MDDVQGANTPQEPDEPQEAPQVEAEEVVEPASQEPEQPSEPVNEGAEAPEDDEDYDLTPQVPMYNQQYQFEAQEDGSVDPYQVAQQIEERLLNNMKFQKQEERAWAKIEAKHPEIKNDRDLRELILNQRVAEAVQGKEGNLSKIADRLVGRMRTAKSEGRADANTSTKVQKAASLETNTANTGGTKSNDLMERISNGDKYAAQDLLGQWLSEGKL